MLPIFIGTSMDAASTGGGFIIDNLNENSEEENDEPDFYIDSNGTKDRNPGKQYQQLRY